MKKLGIFLCVLSVLSLVFGEDAVRTKDGKRFSGEIQKFDGKILVLKTKYGTLEIPAGDIEFFEKEMWRVKIGKRQVIEGEVIEEDKEKVRFRTPYGELTFPKKEVELEKFKKVMKGTGEEITVSQEEAAQLHRQALALLQQKKFDEAIKVYERILIVFPEDEIALYNTACAYALKGDREAAAEYLKRSVLAGYVDFRHMERDTDLDSIREHPTYKEIMEKKEEYEYKAAHKRLEGLKKRFGENYLYKIDQESRLIFATNTSEEILERLKKVLLEFAQAQWGYLFKNKPTYYITIVLPTTEDFRKLVGNQAIGGFYNHASRTLITPSIGGALIHEFTHALHFADMDARRQQHPSWIVEGFSTCFETSEVRDGKPCPKQNYRLSVVQQAVAAGNFIPLERFFRLNHQQYMQNASLCYAMSRSIMFYLWRNDLLVKFYQTYTEEEYGKDSSGRSAIEKVSGKKLDEFQKEWVEWVKNEKIDEKRVAKGGPFMGIASSPAAGGLQIMQVVAGSPAEKAGLKAGDLVTSIDGQPVASQEQLVELLMMHKPGDVLELEVIRGAEKLRLKIELGTREE
ncbi:MAG: PDZ domain-containing protein [Planctomycetota bacterium]|nr:PDZ domain-containing protein [Planctomycetota bacterium]